MWGPPSSLVRGHPRPGAVRTLQTALVRRVGGRGLVRLCSHAPIAEVPMLRGPEPGGDEPNEGDEAQHRSEDQLGGCWQHVGALGERLGRHTTPIAPRVRATDPLAGGCCAPRGPAVAPRPERRSPATALPVCCPYSPARTPRHVDAGAGADHPFLFRCRPGQRIGHAQGRSPPAGIGPRNEPDAAGRDSRACSARATPKARPTGETSPASLASSRRVSTGGTTDIGWRIH